MLPNIPYKNGASRIPVLRFGGLDRRAAAGNGAITDTVNLTGADAPVLSSRPKRRTAAARTAPRGICAVGAHLFDADAGKLYRDGAELLTLPGDADAERVFAAMGERLLVWPDKLAVNAATGAAEALERSVTASCTFEDGTYAGEAAAANTILAPSGFDWADAFRVGDGVTISGAADAANNKTAVVREIAGRALRFYENTFVKNATARSITVARTIPDLDFLCVCDNRVWGCRGDTIRCSKLGDPANWDVFDGLSTDAWSVESGTPGAFTGCVSFMGCPVFFKEDGIFKVYGSRPSNYELMSSATLGVRAGAAKTLAVAGETLCYLSRAGFVRYSGGYPSAVDAALNARYTGGAAGSDGRRYYVSAARGDGVREFLVFDPAAGLWHKEDALAVRGFAGVGNTLYAQTADADLAVAGADAPDEADFDSSVTFADFDLRSFGSKYPVRLWLRYALDARSETVNGVTTDVAALTVAIRYDGGALQSVVALPSGGKGTRYVPVPIRRCDRFGVKLSANSAWKLYGMEIETRTERTNRKGG